MEIHSEILDLWTDGQTNWPEEIGVLKKFLRIYHRKIVVICQRRSKKLLKATL
jgi:hypothetical protein